MKALGYYISLPFIYLISYLPFWMLYALSDVLFFVVYRVIGYRRKVVFSNLERSFPEKSKAELRSIEIKFFRYFCDLIVETFKSMSISPESLRKRFSFEGVEIFQDYYTQQQSTIIVMGHWGNWELGGARFAIERLHQLFIIYHPLRNKHFDQLFYKMRTRLGNGLYSMKDSLRGILKDREKLTATAFIADQTPPARGAHWMTFLNQETPIFRGTGKIAKKMNYPVIYIGIKRLKRGYYEMKAETLVADPSEVDDTAIIELFTKRLEKDIQEMPEIWLWTHRRWKKKRPTDN